MAIIDKRRPAPNQAEMFGIVGDVKDKTCIIVDDIVDTAGTLCLAANKLQELGAKDKEAMKYFYQEMKNRLVKPYHSHHVLFL